MRRSSSFSTLAALLLIGTIGTVPLRAGAQSGTLQVPAHKPAETEPGKPAPAPRTAVRQVAPAHPTPVVQPHGSPHAIKPSRGQAAAIPPLPLPPPLPGPAPEAAVPSPPPPSSPPATAAEQEKPVGSGLPLPRFAALRSDDVNLRAGPGTRYPIEWIYKRRDLPMEIEREFEVWRLVKAPDGTRGWVHQATLTGRRTFMIEATEVTLRAEPKEDAAPVAILKQGVIGRIRSCATGSAWCHVQVGEYRGFVKRNQFWGTLPDETIAP